MIYADNAATTKLDNDAFEVMKPYLIEAFGNASQPYFFARKSKKALKQARTIIANCIGASPDEVYFTSGGTESDNWAIKGTMLVRGDERITLTSEIEHHAVLKACAAIDRMGYPVTYLPVDNQGTLLPSTLLKYISKNTKLVTVMLANNEIGTIQPIKELVAISHSYGALFHTDAVQAVGHIPINVQELGVDMLSASAHKFNGPKGIGFLYIRKGTYIQPYEDGGSQEFGMRAGTENVASIIAMAIALKKNVENILASTKKLMYLEDVLLNMLSAADIDYIRNGSDQRLPGNISLSFRNAEGEVILNRLDLMGICVSTASACDSIKTQISHVIRAIDVSPEYAKGTIRISFGANNGEDDAIAIARALIKIIATI